MLRIALSRCLSTSSRNLLKKSDDSVKIVKLLPQSTIDAIWRYYDGLPPIKQSPHIRLIFDSEMKFVSMAYNPICMLTPIFPIYALLTTDSFYLVSRF